MASENGTPLWVKLFVTVGLPTVLVFYLLGMIPGVRSPIDRILDKLEAHDTNIAARAAQTASALADSNEELLRTLRTICRYQVPRGQQWECDPVRERGPR